MRISDWSSDVCSSDLWLPALRHRFRVALPSYMVDTFAVGRDAQQRRQVRRGNAIQQKKFRLSTGRRAQMRRLKSLVSGVCAAVAAVALGQIAPGIGGASCRERVCRSVEKWVVEV